MRRTPLSPAVRVWCTPVLMATFLGSALGLTPGFGSSGFWSSTAGAQVSPTNASVEPRVGHAVEQAVVALQGEVLSLVELGAFDAPVSPKLEAIHGQWANSLVGLDRVGLVTWARDADEQGAIALDQLRAAGVIPTGPMTAALGRLSQADDDRLDSGQTISVPAGAYNDALTDLERLANSGAVPSPNLPMKSPISASGLASRFPLGAPAPTAGPSASTSTPATAVTPGAAYQPFASKFPRLWASSPVRTGATPIRLATVAASGDRRGSAPTETIPWFVVAVAAAAVVLSFIAARRRRVRRSSDGESVASLLDAARRLGSSLESSVVAAVAVDEARAMTRAGAAAFVAIDDGIVSVNHESHAGSVALEHLDRGVIRRVLDTGQPARAVVTELAFSRGATAVVVVPILCSGRVIGALCVMRRRIEGAFRAEDQDMLCQLAPLVAGAFDTASVHDGITELTLTDGLTSLANRRRLDRDLSLVLADGRRPVGFLMIDIDHFKTYNDTNGHVAGDATLRQVAGILAQNARPGDVVYRYGGEEFCVLLADTSADDAALVAERLRAAIEAETFDGAQSQPGGRITVSVGLALTDRADAGEIKQRADAALYEAKHRGRNRVEVSDT